MTNLFDKLSAAEDNFTKSRFLSPVLSGQKVKVRIDGIILTLPVKPRKFSGWGVFRPKSFKEAIFVRDATIGEREDYLKLFPPVRFILCQQNEHIWQGVPLHADGRFKITGIVPIVLAAEVRLFDTVQARFDGSVFWFDQIYEKHNGQNAVYLRNSFDKFVVPNKLDLKTLTDQERFAYKTAFDLSEEAKKSAEEQRIRSAVERGGATYRNHIDRGTTYTVEYTIGSSTHRSVIQKSDLQVISAGICLAGEDHKFDLQSLMSVMRIEAGYDPVHGRDRSYDDHDYDY